MELIQICENNQRQSLEFIQLMKPSFVFTSDYGSYEPIFSMIHEVVHGGLYIFVFIFTGFMAIARFIFMGS